MIIWYWSVKGGVGTSVVAAATAIRFAEQGSDTALVDLMGDQPALLGLPRVESGEDEPGIGDWITAGKAAAPDAIGRLQKEIGPHLRLLGKGTTAIPLCECGPGAQPVSGNGSAVPPGQSPDTSDPGSTPESDAAIGARRLMLALEMLARSGPVVVDAGLDTYRLRLLLSDADRPVCVLRACYLALSRAQQVPGPYEWVTLVEEPGRALRSRDVAGAIGGSNVTSVRWDPRVARSVDAGTIVTLLPPPLRRFELPS